MQLCIAFTDLPQTHLIIIYENKQKNLKNSLIY